MGSPTVGHCSMQQKKENHGRHNSALACIIDVRNNYIPHLLSLVRYLITVKKAKMHSEVVESLGFVKVAETSEIPAGKMKMIKLEGKDVLLKIE